MGLPGRLASGKESAHAVYLGDEAGASLPSCHGISFPVADPRCRG
jgi:hypothetical protein